MAKFVTAAKAASHIKDGMRVGLGGFSTSGAADAVLRAMGRSFAEHNTPKDLSIIAPTISGDKKENGYGMTAIGAEGLISKIYSSRIGNAPPIMRLADEGKIAVFILPMGVFGHLFRAQAGHKPGIITNVGKYTFADPRNEGGKMNQLAVDSGEELVSLINIDGKEYLYYRTMPMDACIIRASYADEDCNITLKNEVLPAEQVEMAQAVHNNGGIVIVQVSKVVANGSILPREVDIYNKLVDYIVVATPEEHPFTYVDQQYRPEMLNLVKVPTNSVAPMEMGIRKVVARRGAMELVKGSLVNLGLGISDGVSLVANEEGLKDFTLTIETGIFGGIPFDGPRMGTGVNADATYKMASTFDIYDGGVLDCCYLSFAETDEEGNVNVSKFGGKIVGPGGFVNISQNTKRICFMATFTAGGLNCEFGGGKMKVLQEGRQKKFRKKVDQITFSGRYAVESGQEVLYITERAVFRLTPEGMMLIEIAPGVDLEKDILANMEFRPLISPDLKPMDARIFNPEKMGLTFKS